MKRFYVIYASLLIVLGGCASHNYAEAQPSSQSTEYSVSPEEAGYVDTSNMLAIPAKEAADISENSTLSEDKKIKSGDISIETNNFDEAFAQIESLVLDSGGYTEKSRMGIYGQEGLKEASITLRIPAEKYDGVKTAIALFGRVTESNESIEDVTGQYYDIEVRLERKMLEEERLLDMIDDATETLDLIELEKRLSEVRTDIEIFQNRLNGIDSLVSYSTLKVFLNETAYGGIRPPSDDLGGRIAESFSASINFLLSLLERVILAVTWLIIPLAVLALPVLAGVFIYKKTKRG